jgi:REP element-mobilizing transposase RayT
MPRRPRKQIVLPGVPHHICVRGNNRRRLFSYPSDYRQFLYLVGDAFARCECPLHQLTLMPNHAHFMATPPETDSLSDAMKSCLQRYAQRRNKRKNASGRLFEERFWCEPLTTLESVEAITLYTDSNAMQAAMVDHPAQHRWSTCAIHYGQPDRTNVPLRMWTPSDWYASLGPNAPTVYQERMTDFLNGRMPDWVVRRMRAIESLASPAYRRRIRRPDGSSSR